MFIYLLSFLLNVGVALADPGEGPPSSQDSASQSESSGQSDGPSHPIPVVRTPDFMQPVPPSDQGHPGASRFPDWNPSRGGSRGEVISEPHRPLTSPFPQGLSIPSFPERSLEVPIERPSSSTTPLEPPPPLNFDPNLKGPNTDESDRRNAQLSGQFYQYQYKTREAQKDRIKNARNAAQYYRDRANHLTEAGDISGAEQALQKVKDAVSNAKEAFQKVIEHSVQSFPTQSYAHTQLAQQRDARDALDEAHEAQRTTERAIQQAQALARSRSAINRYRSKVAQRSTRELREWALQNRNEVNRLREEVIQQLDGPTVTVPWELNPEAREYIREQANHSQALAEESHSLAQASAPAPLVGLLGTFARYTLVSINDFLGGFTRGWYQGFDHASRALIGASRAIYHNPRLLEEIAPHLMRTITDARFISGIREGLTRYWNAIEEGRFADSGEMTGRFASDVLITVATLEATGAGRAFEPMVRQLTPSGAAENLGNQLLRDLANTPLAPESNRIQEAILNARRSEIAAREQLGTLRELPVELAETPVETVRVTSETPVSQPIVRVSELGTRHGPLNPGRLHEIPADRRIPIEQGGSSVADTFRSSSYTRELTTEPNVLYRVSTEPPILDLETGLPESLPRYYSTIEPQGPLQSQIDSSLRTDWGNEARWVTRIEVPSDQTIYRGFASEQRLNPEYFTGEHLMGGGPQVYIENVNPQWYRDSWRIGR